MKRGRQVRKSTYSTIPYIKQGYALKNWVEGLSDEAYYPYRVLPLGLGVTKKI